MTVTEIDTAVIDDRAARRSRGIFGHSWKTAVLRSLCVVAFILAAWAALIPGLQLRRWVWDFTKPIHYYPDVQNGYNWGVYGNEHGFLNVYDDIANKHSGEDNPEYHLDYAPLRLLLMTRWVAWTKVTFPKLTYYQGQYRFFFPTLTFNTVMELIGAVGIFLLTRHWARRGDAPPPRAKWWTWRCIRLIVLRALPEAEFTAQSQPVRPFRGWISGLIAALLFWFNPAVIISGHGWPTWDLWIVPFFVWTVLLASWDLWFWSGICLGVGAMFKGQELFVAPLFVLWPIFAGRRGRALQWLAGLILAVGAIASPWLLSYQTNPTHAHPIPRAWDYAAIYWLIDVAVATTLLPVLLRWLRPWKASTPSSTPASSPGTPGEERGGGLEPSAGENGQIPQAAQAAAPTLTLPRSTRGGNNTRRWAVFLVLKNLAHGARPWAVWIFLLFASIALLTWPFAQGANGEYLLYALPIACLIVALSAMLRPRYLGILAAGSIGAALLCCALVFHGNLNWLYIGWGYGTRHFYHMTMGVSDNLAGIMDLHYGWNLDDIVGTIDPHPLRLWPTHTILFAAPTDLSVHTFLVMLYAVSLVICAMAVAIQYRRNDRNFLIAITAPWLMFFTLMPQIHERYLLYAAGVGCTLTAVCVGMTLLDLLLTFLTAMMTMHVMLIHGDKTLFASSVEPGLGWKLTRFINGTHPDAGWAVLLCAGIFLFLSFIPSRRSMRRFKRIEPIIEQAPLAASSEQGTIAGQPSLQL